MNFGQKGRELLQELKRSDWLPLYSEDAVSRCLLECQGHMAQIRPALAQEMVSTCGVGCEAECVRARFGVWVGRERDVYEVCSCLYYVASIRQWPGFGNHATGLSFSVSVGDGWADI